MKGIVYYTHHKCDAQILHACQKQVRLSGVPVISVSQRPINFGENIVVDLKPSILSMFKQILIGLQASKSDVIFQCEHDVLYHPSHFEFTPTERKYYFNTNVWTVNSTTGEALWYDDPGDVGRKMTSGLVGYRDLLIEHFTKKIRLIEKHGFSHRKIGFRPGKIDRYKTESYQSCCPNIDIKHGRNISRNRFKLEQFKIKDRIKGSFKVKNKIPCWGITLGRFDEFLTELQ